MSDMKTIDVDGEIDIQLSYPDTTGVQLSAWLQAKLAEIPAEYRESALVRGHAFSDGEEVTLRLTYERPYTEEELAWARDAAAHNEAAREARLRQQYEALKAKFEGEA